MQRLLTLPDHAEVYPAHFRGAAWGKGLSGKPMMGFERRFNPALRIVDRDAVVRFALEGLPPPPPVFAVNRSRNLGREEADG